MPKRNEKKKEGRKEGAWQEMARIYLPSWAGSKGRCLHQQPTGSANYAVYSCLGIGSRSEAGLPASTANRDGGRPKLWPTADAEGTFQRQGTITLQQWERSARRKAVAMTGRLHSPGHWRDLISSPISHGAIEARTYTLLRSNDKAHPPSGYWALRPAFQRATVCHEIMV